MVFHVGIAPLCGEMALFNTKTSRTKISDFREVGKNNIDEIEGMYKRIKATAKDDLGYAGIYLGSSYGNEIRQKFIQCGLEAGFKKVEIIDWETQMFLNAISQVPEYHPKNGDTICVINGKLCYFWYNKNGKFEYKGADNGIFNADENAENNGCLKTDDPNVICYEADSDMDHDTVVRLLPPCHVTAYEHNGDAAGALLKARIMAGDENVVNFDCCPKLDRNLNIKVGERKILAFEANTCLPLKESVKLKVEEAEKVLSIGFGYFDDRIMDDITLPVDKEIMLNVVIDKNGIVSVDFCVF